MNKPKVNIGLLNPKSPDNVSSVMRSAGNFKVDSIFYTGTRYPKALALNPNQPKMSRSVSLNVPVIGVDDLLDDVPNDMKIICVEFALNASSLVEFIHPSNAYYIFGPEDGTLTQSIIDQADHVLYVPTVGCLNLAATVNIVLYDRLSKSQQDPNNNALIRESRDTNNNIKVNIRK